jgi:cytochrome c oxidase cbb3-type subunit III
MCSASHRPTSPAPDATHGSLGIRPLPAGGERWSLPHAWRFIPLLLLAAMLAACEREERSFRSAPANETREQIALSSLSPGPNPPNEVRSGKGKEYEGNAFHLSQGKKLFTWFNCSGCHGNGGGGSGPALMDDKWIYGGEIENIVATIREGRPNGMPSFRGKIADDQIWELAAYVRSMSGNAPSSAAPTRNDDIQAHPAENRMPQQPPAAGNVPASAERPQ